MRILLVAAVLAFLVACASSTTKTSTRSNPEFAGQHFQKVVVVVRLDDAVVRKQMEDAFVAQLGQNGIAAFSALAVWGSGVEPKAQEARLAEDGIDSVLVVQLQGTGMSAKRTASSSAPSAPNTNPAANHEYVTTTAYDPMNSFSGPSPTSTSRTTTTLSPYAVFMVGLVDAATKRTAWVDKAKSTGSGAATMETVRDSFIETTVRDLVAADVLVRTPAARH
jgi:hypothetical protein